MFTPMSTTNKMIAYRRSGELYDVTVLLHLSPTHTEWSGAPITNKSYGTILTDVLKLRFTS